MEHDASDTVFLSSLGFYGYQIVYAPHMGRVGSRQETARWEGVEEAPSLACILSVRRASGKEDDSTHVCHIVDCKLEGNSAALQQRFTSIGPEDPEGKVAAICFALSTCSLPAFRAFLFEHPKFWSSRSGASCLTGDDTPDCFTVFVSPRKNTSLGLGFTAAICRLQNGCLRSISFRSNSEQVGIELVTRFLHSSKCRSWVQRVITTDSTFASEPDALPAICNRCGESEYYDQKSQQASEDYLCPACLMMEKEVILAIRLEEQSEDAENWEKLLNESGSVCMEDNCDTCCICGCEDNEDLDDLVPCTCESSQAVVHTSCAAACTSVASPKFSNLGSTPLCLICGRGPGIKQNGGLGRCKDDGMQARGSKRSMQSTQVAGVEVKRPRMSSPVQVENIDSLPKIVERESNIRGVQIKSKDTDCSKMELARHGWRFADVPAVVPFKKRRIQIFEVPRSPSPPHKQISPKIVSLSTPRTMPSLLESISVNPTTSLKSHSPKSDCLPLDSPPSNATPLLPGSSSPTSLPSSKSTTPALRLCTPNKVPPVSKPPSPQPRSSSPQQTCSSPKSPSLKPTSQIPKLPIRSSGSSPSHNPRVPVVETAELCCNSSLKPSEQGLRPQLLGTCREGFYHVDTQKVMKESHTSYMRSSCSANQNQPSNSQEVEDGELVMSTEKDLDEFEMAGELPEVCSQGAGGYISQSVTSNPGGFHDDRSSWDLNTDMDTWDKLSNKVAHARKKMGRGSRTMCESINPNIHGSRRILTANKALENSSCELVKKNVDIGKHDECGISLSQQVEVNNEQLTFSEVAAMQQSEGLGMLEIRNHAPKLVNSASWKEGEETCKKQGLQKYRSTTKVENQARTKREEWDELVEEAEGEHVDYGDFDGRDGDDAGTAMDDGSLMLEEKAYWRIEDTMGGPSFWESKTMSDSGGSKRKQADLIESCMEKCSTSGRVKSSGWDQLPDGFDSAEEALKAAQELLSRRGRGSWVNPGGRGSMQGSLSGNQYNSRRDEFRDSSGRHGDRCVDESSHGRESYNHTRRPDNSTDDYRSARGRGSGRGAAGVHGRGCFNGWGDNRQSSSLYQWGPGRHRSSSGFSSQRATNAAAVAAARVESSGFVVAPDGTISRGGRPNRVLRSTFGSSCGARVSHTNGQAPLTDLESGPNFPSRMERHMGRSSNIGGDMGTRQGAGPGFAGRMSERGTLAGCGNVDRYGGSSYGGRSALRRSESPRRLHPSDHSYMRRRTPCLRPEFRVTRSRMSPLSPEPFGLPKFYPGSARDQCSPPPFPKWYHDRREGQSFRERDFKRPLPRSHGSSGRTSPHVVHGSSLMDERDWRVLAGTRSSPGARGGLNSCVHSGKSMDGSAELHRSRQAEEEEEHTHSISKDSDHGQNSPREVDRGRDNRGSAFKRDRSRDDDKKRESYRLPSMCTGGYKCASSRDEDDDNPPRRHRPSW